MARSRFDRAVVTSLVHQLPADPAAPEGIDVDRLVRTLDLLALDGQWRPRSTPRPASTGS